MKNKGLLLIDVFAMLCAAVMIIDHFHPLSPWISLTARFAIVAYFAFQLAGNIRKTRK